MNQKIIDIIEVFFKLLSEKEQNLCSIKLFVYDKIDDNDFTICGQKEFESLFFLSEWLKELYNFTYSKFSIELIYSLDKGNILINVLNTENPEVEITIKGEQNFGMSIKNDNIFVTYNDSYKTLGCINNFVVYFAKKLRKGVIRK